MRNVHDVVSLNETLVFVKEAYPDAANYRPGARLPVDFRRLDESESAPDFTPFLSLSPVLALDASIDRWNCPSITVDRRSGLRLGLHLDSWDDLDVSSRWKSRNRMVVNRGPGDRYGYVVAVPVEDMAGHVGSPERLHPCEVADTYIRSARGIPCSRLHQPANVAYVCCT